MIKRYKSHSVLSLSVNMGKSYRRIEFSQAVNGGEYSTDDPEEQKALEDSPLFNEYFRLVSTDTGESAAKEDASPVTDVPGISSCIEARDFLTSKGSTQYLRSKEDIKAEAQRMGYRFTEL